jgi:RNA polymerase sigma factor (sigma-70 family)
MEKQRNTPDTFDLPTHPQVDAFRSNDRTELRKVYMENYPKVLAMVLKNQGTQEQAKDIFQEAFIAAWKNIREGRFTPKNESAINGYIYTIAKNKWLDYQGSLRNRKTVSLNPEIQQPVMDDTLSFDTTGDQQEEKLNHIMKAMESIGEVCKGLLIKFYFENKSMKEIAEELQIDPASTRNKKYRCMQMLRELAFNPEIK